METLLGLETALVTALTAGCLLKLILLSIQMAMNPEEKGSYLQEIKRVIVVGIISLLVSSGSIMILVTQYTGTGN